MDTSRVLRVAAGQVRIDVTDRAAGISRAVKVARHAAAAGARLVVLPELMTSGYVFTSPAEAEAAAEELDGPAVRTLSGLARELGIVIVAGMAERRPDGIGNTSVVVDGGAEATLLAGSYRKTHLWDQEHRWFRAGDAPPVVVSTSVGRVGLVVCYDLEMPECVRVLRESGAEIVCAPVNWPLLTRPDGERPIEVTKAQAAASAYRVPVVVADRCGSERGVEWIGGSCVIGADGYLVAGPILDGQREDVLVADVEVGVDTSLGEFNDALGDRRPELYG